MHFAPSLLRHRPTRKSRDELGTFFHFAGPFKHPRGLASGTHFCAKRTALADAAGPVFSHGASSICGLYIVDILTPFRATGASPWPFYLSRAFFSLASAHNRHGIDCCLTGRGSFARLYPDRACV